MSSEPLIVIRFGRRAVMFAAVALVLVAAFIAAPSALQAQKIQEKYSEKFNIADPNAGVSVAVSADGKYVVVAGPHGVIVSDDFGKTASWVQTVRLK
jgi:CubicO group peptidase (beta-lactamase class C family)